MSLSTISLPFYLEIKLLLLVEVGKSLIVALMTASSYSTQIMVDLAFLVSSYLCTFCLPIGINGTGLTSSSSV